MFISVQFKDKNMNFRGKLYDYEVDFPPKAGSIVRMVTKDKKNFVANGTRVRVVEVRHKSKVAIQKIVCIPSSLEEKSFSEI